jgi:uncharacterized membrane protein HdeD (DUF308 family)
MSGIAATPGPHGLGYRHIAGRWGWFVALGIVMILAGFFALGETELVTLVSVIFIGAALLVSGIFQIIHAFMTKGWAAFALNLACGVLYILGGFLIMDEPVQGSVIITIMLTVVLMVGGVVRIVIGLRHRELAHWWMMVLGGVISLLAGILLYASLPWSGLFVLGTIISIELIFQGTSWLFLGLSLRRHHTA